MAKPGGGSQGVCPYANLRGLKDAKSYTGNDEVWRWVVWFSIWGQSDLLSQAVTHWGNTG